MTETFEKRGLNRTESIIFMKEMIKNASIQSLLNIYELEEMF